MRYTGDTKKLPVTKTLFVDLSYAFTKSEAFGEAGRLASSMTMLSWLLENGKHDRLVGGIIRRRGGGEGARGGVLNPLLTH